MTEQLFTGRVHKTPERRAGFAAISLFLHGIALALLILFSQRDASMPGGVGPGTGGGGGGGGGGGEEVLYISVSRPPPPPPPPPPDDPEVPELEIDLVVTPPIPEPEVVVVVDSVPLSTLEPSAQVASATPATGTGAGTGDGTGPGAGGGSGGGDGGGVGPGSGSGSGPGQGGGEAPGSPPRPKMLLLPPGNAPREMRGKTIVVRLLVDSNGAVREVALIPETGNDDFDDNIRRTAMAWQFYPGTDAAGRVVATAFQTEWTF